MKISRLAVGDRTLAPSQTTFAPPAGLAQDRHIDGLPLGTRGGVVYRHMFPLDAEYEFSMGGRGGGPGVDLTLDGAQVKVDNPRNFRLKVPAGPHVIGLAVVDRQRGAGVDEIYSDFRTNATFITPGGVPTLVVTGPYNATGVGDTPSRRAIYNCKPASAADETACARTILTTLARRAYRGPVSAAEINTLVEFYRQGRQAGDFDTGIQQALARILVSPRFVYRIEEEPATVASGQAYRVSDVELASRLSFFLWSSIPDDELRDVAMKGRLRDPQTLAQQVKRMLADTRADALVDNFAGQWLYLRELEHVQTEAKSFDENLRRAFRTETEMLFSAIVREDRSLIDLIDADYTFVDERLARHYGIPNVKGSYFRRVPLAADSPRRGLLGQGSVLTVTSTATRTSPVVRGKWVLENLLGTPAPVPPPGVETNLGGEEGAKTSSVRERLEAHRASPTCASCHKIMDPDGVRARELRSRWSVARVRRPQPDRLEGSARGWHAGERSGGSPPRGPEPVRYVHDHGHREADDVCARPPRARVRHAGCARDRPPLGREQQPVLVAHHGHHRQRLVPEAGEEVEATRQTSSPYEPSSPKRTCPGGPFFAVSGVTLSLPLLESMIPAATLLGQTVAKPRTRLGAIYFPHGAIMPQWTPGPRAPASSSRRFFSRSSLSTTRSTSSAI